MPIRSCTVCKKQKSLEDDFYRSKYGKNGYIAQCKECRKEYSRKDARLARKENPSNFYHRLTNINSESRTAMCSRCGPCKLRSSGKRGLVCATSTINLRKWFKTEYIKLKDGKLCTDCKLKYPYYVMQWDHLKEKTFNIANRLNKNKIQLNRILTEITKCELVCANCHAERTHKRGYKNSDG